VKLSEEGHRQARHLSDALRWLPLSAVYSSPLERAMQTAAPLAHDHNLTIRVRPSLTDIDFGAWTGRTLDELAQDARWLEFNEQRSRGSAPGGESLTDVQRRVMAELLHLSRRHHGEIVAIVTHAEPIRCVIAELEGVTLDDVLTVEISPAHVSAVGLGPSVRRVLAVNLAAEKASV